MVSKKKKGGAKAMDTEGDGGFNYGAFAMPTLQLSLRAARPTHTTARIKILRRFLNRLRILRVCSMCQVRRQRRGT